MNVVTLQGRLTKDPERKEKRIIFTVAVPTYDRKSAYFIPCVAFRSTAGFVERYFHKGDPIIVQGELTSYNNAENKTYHNVVCSSVEFPMRPPKKGSNEEWVENKGSEPLPF